MRKSLFTILLVTGLATVAYAQIQKGVKSGVYLTSRDFLSQKLTQEAVCGEEKHIIRLNDFLEKSYIEVICKDKKEKYEKSQIYGYRDCSGNDYRFFDNKHVQIVEAGQLYIYSFLVYTHSSSTKERATATYEYYFSIGPEGKIQPLSLDNLKSAFPDNHKFHDLLDTYFRNSGFLGEYDTFHKTYRVNHLLQSSK